MSANSFLFQNFSILFYLKRLYRGAEVIDWEVISEIYIHNLHVHSSRSGYDEGTWSKFIREHYSVTCTRQCSLNVFM